MNITAFSWIKVWRCFQDKCVIQATGDFSEYIEVTKVFYKKWIDSDYLIIDFSRSRTSYDGKSRSFHLLSVDDKQDHMKWQKDKCASSLRTILSSKLLKDVFSFVKETSGYQTPLLNRSIPYLLFKKSVIPCFHLQLLIKKIV